MEKQEFHDWCNAFIESGKFTDINQILETVNSIFLIDFYCVGVPEQAMEICVAVAKR
jgi:hypothetical protein